MFEEVLQVTGGQQGGGVRGRGQGEGAGRGEAGQQLRKEGRAWKVVKM